MSTRNVSVFVVLEFERHTRSSLIRFSPSLRMLSHRFASLFALATFNQASSLLKSLVASLSVLLLVCIVRSLDTGCFVCWSAPEHCTFSHSCRHQCKFNVHKFENQIIFLILQLCFCFTHIHFLALYFFERRRDHLARVIFHRSSLLIVTRDGVGSHLCALSAFLRFASDFGLLNADAPTPSFVLWFCCHLFPQLPVWFSFVAFSAAVDRCADSLQKCFRLIRFDRYHCANVAFAHSHTHKHLHKHTKHSTLGHHSIACHIQTIDIVLNSHIRIPSHKRSIRFQLTMALFCCFFF